MAEARSIIHKLELAPHPEGGWWRLYYLATDEVWVERLQGHRQAGSSIAYLLEEGDFSAIHVLRADEVWHYQGGSPMRLMWIDTEGVLQDVLVGPAEMDGALLQVLVPQGCHMAAESTGSWSLVACTMAPAFHEDDFTLCRQADLLGLYPQYTEWIIRFTRH